MDRVQGERGAARRAPRTQAAAAANECGGVQDMFRKVETPAYTNVYSDSQGTFGVVEYNSHRELRSVMADMRGAEFKNPFCEPTRVELVDDTDPEDRDAGGSASPDRGGGGGDRARSRSRSRSRSRDREPRARSRCVPPPLALPLCLRAVTGHRGIVAA